MIRGDTPSSRSSSKDLSKDIPPDSRADRECIAAAALRADRQRVQHTGRWLVRHSTDRCSATVGLALLAADSALCVGQHGRTRRAVAPKAAWDLTPPT